MMDNARVFTGRRVWPRCFDRTCILGCYQVVSECQGGFVVTTGASVRPVGGEALAGVSASAGGQLSLRSTKRAIDYELLQNYEFCNQGSVGTAFSSDLAASRRLQHNKEDERGSLMRRQK